MTNKKKKVEYVEEEEPAEEVELETQEMADIPAELPKICLNCKSLSQGLSGPTCSNPESPYSGQRVREEDTCEKFTAKEQ